MAFLGSIGKALGLGGEGGKGFVTGLATSLTKGFDDDMKRTKDNVDNLVLESYKGGRTEKLRFDKEYKENETIIKQIASTIGGADGVKHPQAYDGAQFLISKYGIDGAVKMADKLNTYYGATSRHPIDSLQLVQKNDRGAITSSMLANEITTPVSLPDMAALGKSANVGIMKSNFLGPAYDASGEIEQRSNALLQASGIDIDKEVISVPEALKGNIDPLILGMLENPTAELLRLHKAINQNDKLGKDKDLDLEKRALGMIKSLQASVDALKKGEYLKQPDFENIVGSYKNTMASRWNLLTTANAYKSYKDVNGTPAQLGVLDKSSRYYANAFNFAMKNASTAGDYNQYDVIIRKAMWENKKIIMSNDDGVFIFKADDTDTGNYLTLNEISKLTKGEPDPILKDPPAGTNTKITEKSTLKEISDKIATDMKINPKAADFMKDKWMTAWNKDNKRPEGVNGTQHYQRGLGEFEAFKESLG
jgi:hypothetical protein